MPLIRSEKIRPVTILLMLPEAARAHTLPDATQALTFDLAVAATLAVAAALYVRGLHRRRTHPARALSVFAGLLALALALLGPLDAWSGRSFAAHMLQHMLLIAVAPVLLVLGTPLAAYAALVPLRRLIGALPWRALERPAPAFALHALVLWTWHSPRAFEAALRSEALHAAEHVTLFITALLFWWSALQALRVRAAGYGAAALLFLLTMMHTGLLGALLTFAPRVLYPLYENRAAPFGLAPLEDQQLAGLIMWILGGLAYLGAGLVVAALWLRDAERRGAWAAPTQPPHA